jgi:methylmalonyl-CoA/ethylmalonyl-CoA epimerase
MPRYLAIDHLGIVVKDLEAAARTYGETLGFTVEGGEELPARGLAVRFVDAGNSRLELIAPTRGDSEVSGFLDKRGEGLHHVCLRVDDLEAALRDLEARGARLIDATPKAGAHGTKVAFLHPKGAHGVLIELVEHPKTGAPHGH